MNIKLELGKVLPLMDKRLPMEQISHQLQPIAKQANLIFADWQPGVNYLQWSLPGTDWTPFTKGNEEEQATVAQIYETRKSLMQNALQGSPLKDIVFSVPSADFVFFRQQGVDWEIALTAWGYRYPDKKPTQDLIIYITKKELQKVNVGFTWNEQILPGLKFILTGNPRETSSDGFLHFDGPLPVGSSCPIETSTGKSYTLVVEKGREDYVFDLTQYYHVNIRVAQDNTPLSGKPCEIHFNGNVETLTTDASGQIQKTIPLLCDETLGQPAVPQPPCIVTCNGEDQHQIPSQNEETLSYVFDFHTEVPPVVKEPTPPVDKHVQVKIEVFQDTNPVVGQACEFLYNGQTQTISTNDKGEWLGDIVLAKDESGTLLEPQPMCEVICGEEHQKKTPHESLEPLVFRFDLPKVEVPKEPEYVYVQLKDYGGAPLVDMPFVLITKKKGRVELRTDTDGNCKLPKEWFTPKEKMKIEFVVSPEYQDSHDLHDSKNKKK